MSLAAGQRLGPYEIVAPLGAGGMGEVYRARDTRLGRDVAVKVLPDDFAHDPERLARFEREAKLLASLNHPNIASIFGLEHADGIRFLAMELVDGEDLSRRLARGPLSVSEAVDLALQLAEALEAAHEKGVVHRDLKPANLVLGADERLKVLDFGLAKALESDSSPDASALSRSPTLTAAMTAPNVILGTAAYMSPEQARGRTVDKRADIWGFGCVLFEMLAGRRPFDGETVSDTLASVLKVEPEWGALPRAMPSSLQSLLRRCLEKDPKLRLRDIGEARVVLKRIDLDADLAVGQSGGAPARPAPRARALTVAGVVVSAAIAGVLGWVLKPAPQMETAWVDLLPPNQQQFEGSLALSPDGRQLVFAATDSTTTSRLWIRDLASGTSRVLAGTESGYWPFWAPDGRALAYFADGKLKRIDAVGGAAQTLCDAAGAMGGTWNESGTILFASSPYRGLISVDPAVGAREVDRATANESRYGGLMAVDAAGGEPRRVFGADSSAYAWPHFLPGGERFLYCDRRDSSAIHVGSLSGKESRRLPLGDQSMGNAALADGHLFYVQDGALRARPFNPDRLELTGDPTTIASSVNMWRWGRRADLAVAPGGSLAFLPSGGTRADLLVTYDRGGRRIGIVRSATELEDLALSPDGSRLAMSRSDDRASGIDVWVYDFNRELFSRLTFSNMDDDPVWSSDGSRIAWAHGGDLYVKSSSGAGAETMIFESPEDKVPSQWSPDGRMILYTVSSSERDQIAMYDIESRTADTLRTSTRAAQNQAQLSRDGRWLAYASDESGENEVFVQDFPAMRDRWQVSTQGGRGPRWKADGTELYYLDPMGRIVAVEVSRNDAALVLGKSSVLFESSTQQFYARHYPYDVSPDGTRFVVIEPEPTGDVVRAVTMVLHWRREAGAVRQGQ